MKAQIFLVVFLAFIQPFVLFAQKTENVTEVKPFVDVYEWGTYYFAGQPTLEVLKFAKQNNVKTIINLRSTGENEDFAYEAFNEEDVVKEFGMKYVSIPMKGRGAYSKNTLEKFAEELSSNNGKVFIHCAGAGRVTYVMMAYLIKYQNYTVDEALAFGKQLTYFSPLEGLLDAEFKTIIK